MKLVVGMGSIDEYVDYVLAGADEIFCGYVPSEWTQKYGTILPINRREVVYVNVQIGSMSELMILSDMVSDRKVPVTITLNSLYYTQRQYPEIVNIILECEKYGFESFILADIALFVYLKEQGIPGKFHVSGEIAECNHLMIQEMKKLNASRIIFHRKISIANMKKCIELEKELEYEAFLMNEKCHYTGAFCNSLHCDEMPHACHLPYRIAGIEEQEQVIKEQEELLPEYEEEEIYIPGTTGCGLCSLWKLKQAGVTHLKIVGRGNYIDEMLEDIKAAKAAINLLKVAKSEEEFIKEVKKIIFPKGCGNNCYYI